MLESVEMPGERKTATGRGWWTLYTRHQHEKSAAEIISIKGAEVFLPLYHTVHRWKDRRAKLSLPLFPCYFFVRENPELRLSILSTPGIVTMVTLGDRFALISDEEIENLRKVVRSPLPVEPCPYLCAGERVRVSCGLLEGVEGILVRQKDSCRVVISVDMLARSAAIEVNAWEVVPAVWPHPAAPAWQMAINAAS